MNRFIIISLFILCSNISVAQIKTTRLAFGFQYKPIIPINFLNSGKFNIENKPFQGTVIPKLGHSFGGILNVGFTKMLALETGINYVRRNFDLIWEIQDSSITKKGDVGIVNYDIPINFLVYIRLAEKFYMNASVGVSILFFASDVRNAHDLRTKEFVSFEGRRSSLIQGAFNSNVGFEYRMKEAGSIYLGASFKLPFKNIMKIAMEYHNDNFKRIAFGDLGGSYLTLDLRYFFKPVISKRSLKKKKKSKIKKDLSPIEQ